MKCSRILKRRALVKKTSAHIPAFLASVFAAGLSLTAYSIAPSDSARSSAFVSSSSAGVVGTAWSQSDPFAGSGDFVGFQQLSDWRGALSALADKSCISSLWYGPVRASDADCATELNWLGRNAGSESSNSPHIFDWENL
ncbi:hypothetical protein EUZ85_00500 [Hahella sp. KA22]|uniref:hypothetical protein n=1 Tax=Hahella sp. KA22 TaxID=1628392 RepID=UPI000FDF63ED|nr:hypothetical protein [Hahella sp. KA22]AZZ94977.1 hypothetical protein ENC22_28790 [Hahella sp. KA22]QAY52622.1 hypothetical protein EUZ85_00500 [Hahella sp. KA22]